MSELLGLGLPLRTTATIWKKGRALDSETILTAMEEELHEHGAESVRTEDGLRAQLPVVQWKPRRITQWLKELPFEEVRTIEVRLAQTDRAFHLDVSGRTSILVPITATVFAYGITAGLVHPLPFVPPLVGVAVGLATWGHQWIRFSVGVQRAADRCAAAMAGGGA